MGLAAWVPPWQFVGESVQKSLLPVSIPCRAVRRHSRAKEFGPEFLRRR